MKSKFLEFNIEDIPIGQCKFIDTEKGVFEICRGKKKIEIYRILTGL